MRHIQVISKKSPESANAIQDFLCVLIEAAYGLFTATGGSLPFLTYMYDKCQPMPVDGP